MIEQHLLARLKEEQSKYALQSLQMPNEKTEFEYGYRAGKVAGYEAAVNALLELLRDEREDKFDL